MEIRGRDMSKATDKRIMIDYPKQLKRLVLSFAVITAAFLIFAFAIPAGEAFAATVNLSDTDANKGNPPKLASSSDVYVITGNYGSGGMRKTSGSFEVPENCGTETKPVTIILDSVNISQEGEDPDHSYILIQKGSYVLIKLRNTNHIIAGKNNQVGSDDGMACIHVSKGATLTIDSDSSTGSTSGTLKAKGGGEDYGGAAIGTRYNEDCGTIVIKGGTIEAEGAKNAAGIGGGRDGDANAITITGGKIEASGGEYGCGIGSGNHVGVGSNDGGDLRGPITISGGTIEATGGRGAAGIGSSDEGKFYGGVEISGGKVTAKGGSLAPGIGSGNDASFHDGAKVRITGGTISATGGISGAGIGGGSETNGTVVEINQAAGKDLNITATGGEHAAGIGTSNRNLQSVDITLRGGTIAANGGENGAGIGSGEPANELYTANAINIDIKGTGTIIAHGGRNGAGIGAGNDSEVSGHITITGDNTANGYGTRGEALAGGRGLDITAVASYGRNEGSNNEPAEYENEAAAIGSGKATCGDISISNAVLHTKADCQGADIGGGGYHVNPSGAIANIDINNCEITSSSTHKVAPGIGAGYGGTVHNITISNSRYVGSGIGGAPMDWNYTNLNDVKKIHITNSYINAAWDEQNPGKFVGNLIPTDHPMDHGAAGIGSGQYGDMDDITITDSYIYARGYGSGAGIGGGGAGGSNYSLIPVKKLDIGDTHSITIRRSTVTAYSGCAELTDYGQLDLWDGYSHYKIDLAKFGGGAGIGSGSASSMTDLTITDCDRVYAKGYKGCGIGAGCGTGIVQSGGADHIILENIGEVESYGGENCAGIGTGGGDGLKTPEGSVLSEIFIRNCKVKAVAGKFGAGIGLGSGSKYKDDGNGLRGPQPITIEDSTVEATAGPMGAGIGGSYENRLSRTGGDNPPILIRGKCKVKAYGGAFYYFENGTGTHGGGAGIGGGSGGGGGYIEIDVTETENAAKGTLDDPEASEYYVYAVGGDGAAGIGSAGDIYQIRTADDNNSDTDTVIIRGGAVFAKGGDTYDAAAEKDYFTEDRMMGAGAGIGGGSAQSNIRHLEIRGGYIFAQAGEGSTENDAAFSIGCGGNYSDIGGSRNCGDLIITDGTVIADTMSRFTGTCVINGGSVSAVINNAKDYNGRNVYHTSMKVPDHPRERVGIRTSQAYGADHIYTRVIEPGRHDSGNWVYLYLPQKSSEETCVTDGVFEAEGAQWADMTVGSGSSAEMRHYYGWTDTENTGLLKLEGRSIGVTLSPAAGRDYVGYGDDFKLMLSDGTMTTGNTWTFTAEGAASLTEEGQNPVSLGAYASLHADKFGSFSFHGVCANSPDESMYWGTSADYRGEVEKAAPSIEISEALNKVYDGIAVNAEPAVSTDSSGSIIYEWYQGSTKLNGPPVDAGDYRVVATVAETSIFREGSAASEFSIFPAPVTVKQSGYESGEMATVTAEVFGLYENAGRVHFTVCDADGVPLEDMEDVAIGIDRNGNRYTATLSHTAPAGEYLVVAQYMPDDTPNYSVSEINTCNYQKNPATRSITGLDSNYKSEYGGSDILLSPGLSGSNGEDEWSYSVVHDPDSVIKVKKGDGSYEEVEPAVTVSKDSVTGKDGTISICHAGSAVIEVMVTDGSGTYEPAYAYVTVNVKRAPLTVTSYAYQDNGSGRTKIADAVYGSMGDVKYGLEFGEDGFRNGDGPETFTHGLGMLSAIPVSYMAPASNKAYEIGIEKNGADLQVQVTTDTTKEFHFTDAFFSRDYDITYNSGTLAVGKATLAVKADDASGVYGGTEPEYSWSIPADQGSCDGLAAWDSRDTVFSSEPEIGLKGGRSYSSLDAGEYQGMIKLSGGISANYEPVYADGSLTVAPASISDSRRFSVEVDDTVYNGKVQKQAVKVTDSAYNSGGEAKVLREGIDYTVVYPAAEDMIHAGAVGVSVSAKAGGNYTGSLYASYRIKRAPLRIETESATKIWDGEPLTAAGVSKTGLVAGETLSARATGSITDVGSVPNSCEVRWDGTARESDYSAFEEAGTLTVLPKKGRNAITVEGYTGVYDGQEHFVHAEALISGSLIEYSTDGGDTWREEAPGFKDASDVPYKVLVRVSHANYVDDARAEAETEVVISRAPTAVGQSAVITENEGEPEINVTAEVMGLYEPAGSVRFEIEWPGSAAKIEESKAVAETADGRFVATLTRGFDTTEAPAGDYTVKATYVPAAPLNYLPSDGTQTYNKALINRTLSVDDISASYGGADVRLAPAVVEQDHQPAADDTWTYEVVWYSGSETSIKDEEGQLKQVEPVVAVSDDGTVSILHAGEAVIKVTLKDGGTEHVFADASAFVRVKVDKKHLTVRSYAREKSGVLESLMSKLHVMLTGGPEAVYGELDTMEYGLEFDGLVNGDTEENFTHGMGTLSAVPLDLDSDASDDLYPIMISRNGVSLTIGETEYENAFISRDYQIEYINGGLRVVPASLTDTSRFKAEAADTVYNGRVQKQAVKVTDSALESGGAPKVLEETDDYVVSYPDDEDLVHAGRVMASVSGTSGGNYTDTVQTAYDIKKAALKVVTKSASKKYDGKPLTAGGSMSGLVPDETAALVVTGSQTTVGSSPNTYRIEWNGTARKSDYTLSDSVGTLTVTKADTGKGGKDDNNGNGKSSKGTKTGDDSALPAWIALFGCSVLALLILIIKKVGRGTDPLSKKN